MPRPNENVLAERLRSFTTTIFSEMSELATAVFYGPTDPDAGRTLVRWAFCKRVEVLEEVLSRLAGWGRP